MYTNGTGLMSIYPTFYRNQPKYTIPVESLNFKRAQVKNIFMIIKENKKGESSRQTVFIEEKLLTALLITGAKLSDTDFLWDRQ